jgi:hypothetical protein
VVVRTAGSRPKKYQGDDAVLEEGVAGPEEVGRKLSLASHTRRKKVGDIGLLWGGLRGGAAGLKDGGGVPLRSTCRWRCSAEERYSMVPQQAEQSRAGAEVTARAGGRACEEKETWTWLRRDDAVGDKGGW